MQVRLLSAFVATLNLMSTPAFRTETTGTSKRKRLALVVVALALGALVWFAFRTLRRLMMLGYVDSAIVRVRAVVVAEIQFAKAHPDIGYTCTISQLAPEPASGEAGERGN